MLSSVALVAKCLVIGLARPLHLTVGDGPAAANNQAFENTIVQRPVSQRHDNAAAMAYALADKLRRHGLAVQANEFRAPASTRLRGEPRANVRDIWEDTRLEAMQKLSEHGSAKLQDLFLGERQPVLFGALATLDKPLRYPIAPTADVLADTVRAPFCALNYLCDRWHDFVHAEASLANAEESFRARCQFAGIWWQRDQSRSQLLEGIPTMFSIVLEEVTRLSKKIAVATIFGPSLEETVKRDLDHLNAKYADDSRLGDICAMIRLQQQRLNEAVEPDDLMMY